MIPGSGARPSSGEIASVARAVKALRAFDESFSAPLRRTDGREAAKEAAAALGLRGAASEWMQDWALGAVPRLAEGLRYVINQDQYDKLCERLRRELLREWRERRGSKLGFGTASRAVDLIMMRMGESEPCRRESALGFLRAPLDARTLPPLRWIVDELTDIDFAVDIPVKPGAGFIATEEQYYILQGAIAELARRAGSSPIVYSYWCASA